MIYLFLCFIFATYFSALIIALWFEYPIRTLYKVVLCPPKKIVKLKKDLDKMLSIDNFIGDEFDEYIVDNSSGELEDKASTNKSLS
jgi:hypothetical protein